MPVQRKGMRALQIWVSRVTSSYNSIEIVDLTTSFRNGLAFVGIIHHFRPELIANPDTLRPEDVIGNNDLAYRIAEETLGISSLLESEDMAGSLEPDKFSVVTYLAQFYHLFKSEQVSPNVSLHLSASESESDSPLNTPTSNKKTITFDRSALIEKYGEDIFNDSKSKKIDDDDFEQNNSGNHRPIVVSSTTKSNCVTSRAVASMCQNFEMKAKISGKQS
jgi:hypothetical protein